MDHPTHDMLFITQCRLDVGK